MGLGLVFVEVAVLQASDASSSSSTMQNEFSPEVAKRMFPLSNSVTGGIDLFSSFLQTNSPERRSWAEIVLKKHNPELSTFLSFFFFFLMGRKEDNFTQLQQQ